MLPDTTFLASLETLVRMSPITGDERAILQRAAEILEQHEKNRAAEIQRLYRQYVHPPVQQNHQLGQPRKLTPLESVLLYALERNRYLFSAEQGQSGRWRGEASCRFHLRETALCMQTTTRSELLWGLWGLTSRQMNPGDNDFNIVLTDAHMQGECVQQDLRRLTRQTH